MSTITFSILALAGVAAALIALRWMLVILAAWVMAKREIRKAMEGQP